MARAETIDTAAGPDLDLVRRYEAQLDPARPTAGAIDVTIVGYGEISAVLQFAECDGYVFKRMAGFQSAAQVRDFQTALEEYCAALRARGVGIVHSEFHPVHTDRNGHVLYIVQDALDPRTIGNVILREGTDEEVRWLLRAILDRLTRVYTANGEGAAERLGLDSQVSNWSRQPDGAGGHTLLYIDVGAPFMRRDGREVADFELFANALPFPLRWYFRKYEMQGVLDRFHSLSGVLIDIAGNFIKEGQGDRIPLLLEEADAWRAGPASHLSVKLPTVQQVEKFYNIDARIWTYVLGARKLDRFITTLLRRRPYAHILPGKITRR